MKSKKTTNRIIWNGVTENRRKKKVKRIVLYIKFHFMFTTLENFYHFTKSKIRNTDFVAFFCNSIKCLVDSSMNEFRENANSM